MTLEQLRIFVAVAERQHVTQAAEALHLTQSSVSGAINALERRHAVTLFHRVGRRIELTEAGSLFLDRARDILALSQAAEATLADLGAVRRGSLTVHASQTIASYWLPRHLVRFNARHPAIDLRLIVGNTAQGAKAVREGNADLGFIEGAIDESALAVRVVARDRLVVVVGPQHPWAVRPPSLPAEISDSAWALREAGSGTRSTFEKALREMGVPLEALRIAMELPSNEAICAAVAASELATAVSQSVAEAGLANGKLIGMPMELPERDFSLILHRERSASRAGEAFLAMLGEPFSDG